MNNVTSIVNKTTKTIVTAVLMLAVSVVLFVFSGTYVNAEDIALTVKLNGKEVKSFTMAELEELSDGTVYNYSAWNTNPSFSIKEGVSGATVEAILNDAGIRNKVADTSVVYFTSYDGYERSLTGKQLFGETRYYYPNGECSVYEGINPKDNSLYEGKVIVPAIISLDDEACLYVGQVAPNEENNPLFIDGMAKGGIINVSTEKAAQCEQIEVSAISGSLLRLNTELTLSNKNGSSNSDRYDKIYYTLDGTAPDYGSIIYNWGFVMGIDIKPVLTQQGVHTLKVRVKGYGKQDSVMQSFKFYVGPALTVRIIGSNGVVQKEKTYETLADLKSRFSEKTSLTYSGYNTYPTLSKKSNISGIAIEDIIKDAEPAFSIDDHLNDAIITFKTESDDYKSEFTLGQFFCDRYYYPNAAKGTDMTGGAAQESAYEGAVRVPAIIETTDKNSLEFGQDAPNDQNFAECVDNMLTLGSIEIRLQREMPKCENPIEAKPVSETDVTTITPIHFKYPSNSQDKRMKTYYIVDPEQGDIPGPGDSFYNYAAYFWPEEKVNAPILAQPGTHTIAVKNICYGRSDSDVTYFTYNSSPARPESLSATSASYTSVKITWKKYAYASGYKIYRSTGNGKASLIKTITSGNTTTYTNTGLKTGTTYKYYIIATGIEAIDGTKVNSPLSTTVSAKPVPGTTKVKLTGGKKQVKVKWSKVSGASGYVVYRSTNKTSGFKAVKTIKKGKTVSFTNKKLKSKKTYYYKVKAYRTVSKKKIYGNYSAVVSAKTK